MSSEQKYCIKFSSLFTPENIELVKNDVSIDDIIHKLLENLALNYGIGNIQLIYNKNYKNSGDTKTPIFINSNCLLYHFRIASTEEPRIALSISRKGFDGSELNCNEKISIVFLLVTPKGKPDFYLKIVKSLKENFVINHVTSIEKMDDLQEIWNYIDQLTITLPEIIYAGDFMEEITVYLNESNNLKDAIDKFVNTGYLNIPVIDLARNLVGEVTSNELMNVCLPRYVLWMDDIKPIISFEPFQNMVENEESTWLAEIMNHDCPVVQIDDPLINAAIVMTKKAVLYVYVLDDYKLVGIITMRGFLKKMARE
ncbi:MAG: CBS domain-containing protein [Bacteroidales bacterium]